MKKYFLPIISIFIISIFLSGCNVTVQDQDLVDRPETQITSSGVGITITRISQETKCIGIYRRDITNSKEEDAEIIKIGVLFPSVYKSTDKTYLFEDLIVYTNHKYEYQVRYDEPGNKYYSHWTEEMTIPAGVGYSDTLDFAYKGSSVKFTYNALNMTLQIKGQLTEPGISNFSSDWKPVLAISIPSENITQVFNLTSVADNTTINLKSTLSTDFLDKDIKILGILGQKVVYADPEPNSTIQKEKQIFWTPLINLTIQGYSSGLIKVDSDIGSTGYDFS